MCRICSKGFIKSSGLTQHMRRHEAAGNSAAPTESDKNQTNDSSSMEGVYVLFDGYNETLRQESS